MARSRNIKPGFFVNEELVELPFETRLLFIGLWTLADRRGRLGDRPKKIKMALFPADNLDIDEMLESLRERGFILRYEIADARYIQIINFEKHQNPHKNEAESVIPTHNPEEHSASTIQAPEEHSATHADSLLLIPDSLIPFHSGASLAGKGKPPNPQEKKGKEDQRILPTKKEKESSAPKLHIVPTTGPKQDQDDQPSQAKPKEVDMQVYDEATGEMVEAKSGPPAKKSTRVVQGIGVDAVLDAHGQSDSPDAIIGACQHTHGKYSQKALCFLWKDLAAACGHGFQADLSGFAAAQLKHAQNKVGPEIKDVIVACLQDWIGFIWQVKHETGRKTGLPESPDPTFFHRYINSAVNFKREQAQLGQAVEQTLQSIAPQVKQLAKNPKPVEKEKPATFEEAMAIFNTGTKNAG